MGSLKEFSEKEIELLKLLDYELYISYNEYKNYLLEKMKKFKE
jgi:hypothetical protein